MPIIYDPHASISQGIQQASGALSQALQQRAANRLQQQRFNQQNMLADRRLQQQQQFQQSLLDQKLAQQQKIEELKAASEQQKQQTEQQAFAMGLDAMLSSGGAETPQGLMAFGEAYMQSGGTQLKSNIDALTKIGRGQPQTPAEKLSPVQKKIEETKAEVVGNYISGGKDAQRKQRENLEFLEQNLSKVGRTKYYAGGEFVTPSALFQEYDTTGKLVLDNVIKVFNPAGTLPQAKLKWITETFAISPSDTQEVIRGKLRSMRRLLDEVEPYQEELGELIEKHNGEIPTKDFLRLQKKTDAILDRRISSGVHNGAQAFDRPPDPREYKGRTIIDPVTGQAMTSNGTRWIKRKK